MANITHWIYAVLILLASIQSCSAYCYGYCWYGSWYIWFAVVMTLAICCGALGSYLRRRQMQKALNNRQQAGIVSVQIQGNIPPPGAVPSSDFARPQVYPPGNYPSYAPAPESMMTPPSYQSTVMTNDKVHPDKSMMAAPPTYTEAVSQGAYVDPQGPYVGPHGAYVNPAMDTPNMAPSPTAPSGVQYQDQGQ